MVPHIGIICMSNKIPNKMNLRLGHADLLIHLLSSSQSGWHRPILLSYNIYKSWPILKSSYAKFIYWCFTKCLMASLPSPDSPTLFIFILSSVIELLIEYFCIHFIIFCYRLISYFPSPVHLYFQLILASVLFLFSLFGYMDRFRIGMGMIIDFNCPLFIISILSYNINSFKCPYNP